MDPQVTIIGAGLAGSELALQLAARGFWVRLIDQKPVARTAAQQSDDFCELVCSNSLGADLHDRAPGLLKAELRRLGSLVLACAQETAVPAGGALAVDREAFARLVTERIAGHPGPRREMGDPGVPAACPGELGHADIRRGHEGVSHVGDRACPTVAAELLVTLPHDSEGVRNASSSG